MNNQKRNLWKRFIKLDIFKEKDMNHFKYIAIL